MLGFTGGKAKALADVPIHFAVDDMQIAEDTQTIIGHMIVQWLYAAARQHRRSAKGRAASAYGEQCSDKFLVLGSNSFSGRDVLRSPRRAGLRRSSPPAARRSRMRPCCPTSGTSGRATCASSASTSITISMPSIALLSAERPTHVVNFAAQSMVGESWLNPDHWMMTNVVSTVRLHERLRAYDAPRALRPRDDARGLWLDRRRGCARTQPFNPSTPYAVSRAAGDMSLQDLFRALQFPVLSHARGQRLWPRPAALPHRAAHDPCRAWAGRN